MRAGLILFILLLSTECVGNYLRAGDELESPDSLSVRVDSLLSICQDTEGLPATGLEELIAECDSLIARTERSDNARKRLMLFRLRKCRDFFEYLIETESPGMELPGSSPVGTP